MKLRQPLILFLLTTCFRTDYCVAQHLSKRFIDTSTSEIRQTLKTGDIDIYFLNGKMFRGAPDLLQLDSDLSKIKLKDFDRVDLFDSLAHPNLQLPSLIVIHTAGIQKKRFVKARLKFLQKFYSSGAYKKFEFIDFAINNVLIVSEEDQLAALYKIKIKRIKAISYSGKFTSRLASEPPTERRVRIWTF